MKHTPFLASRYVKMAAPLFHPGRPLTQTKTRSKLKPSHSAASGSYWYILSPSAAADAPYVHTLLLSIGKQHAFDALQEGAKDMLPSFGFTQADKELYMTLLRANARLRHAARCLLKRWMIRRLIRPMNEEDLVTLEQPRQPVTLYDWSGRKRYVYEASTLARDIRECLLQRDYMFPEPHSPRNLLTNQALSPMQLVSLFHQLRATGKQFHWSLAAFEGLSFCLTGFKQRYEHPLRYEVLRSLFNQPTLEDTRSIVFDYIEDEHEFRERPFSRPIYTWALQHAPDASRIQRWRRLAQRHHELAIEIVDEFERMQAQEKEMDACVNELCSPPHDLIALRTEWKKKQIRVVSS
jgi:hypothetical protein